MHFIFHTREHEHFLLGASCTDIMGLILTWILSACSLHVLPVPWVVNLNGLELGTGLDVCLAFSPFSITAYIGCRSLSQVPLGGRSGTPDTSPWFISSTQSCQLVALSTKSHLKRSGDNFQLCVLGVTWDRIQHPCDLSAD